MRSLRRMNVHWAGCVTSTLLGVYIGMQLFALLQGAGPPPPAVQRQEEGTARHAASLRAARAAAAPRTTAAPPPPPPGPDLLFVGVMTADKFLDSRAVAVYDTWGQTVPGSLEFFTSETSGGPADLPIVRLRGVTDQYPPQKKSFMMLKHMYENYGDKYEWFMRADDDVYVRTDRLGRFLRGINSSQPMFIGQAGLGNKAEFGRLSLASQDNYCMGGPGIVMSRATLALIYPHIRQCLANLYTTHEDVEIGRCVKKYAGVSCLWNYEMREIFYHDQKGTDAFTGNLKVRKFLGTITLHPIKVPTLLYRLHNFFLSEQVQEEQRKKLERYRQVVRSTPEDQLDTLSPLTRRLGSPPKLSKLAVTEPEQERPWAHLNNHYFMHTEKTLNPSLTAQMHLRNGVTDATNSLMDYMLSFSQERGRSLKLQELNYAYHRVDPLHGVDMVLDLVLQYVRFRGKRVVQTVRRHAYMQQPFGVPEVRVVPRRDTSTVVNVVVAVSKKVKPFYRFCDNLEQIGLDGMRIIFVFHENDVSEEEKEATVTRMQQMQASYGESISIINTANTFNRASSLMLGASLLTDDDLVLFMDIDVLFDAAAIDSVRQFVVQGKQVYFPIVFSQYNPESLGLAEVAADSPEVDPRRGRFRNFGFGICAVYVSDLKLVHGLDEGITGWGKEDVDFANRLLKSPQNYTMMRTTEPGMIHIYHPMACSSANLTREQRVMCEGSTSTFEASRETVAREVLSDYRIFPFAEARAAQEAMRVRAEAKKAKEAKAEAAKAKAAAAAAAT
ncbi:chondroitin sulfate synthase 1-like isoform X1 [Amphibalanus amphitrite]|uniref:chondroitin sulfate synthase 1-like isoform X1 n=1 Tax=Amphibalanus amphitrite TaxID=1232801 RepID=UPI001C8FBFD3|nr:chondroitin sulfate synthase 1-like isoform X1 [Amphibalanus amphitrite]